MIKFLENNIFLCRKRLSRKTVLPQRNFSTITLFSLAFCYTSSHFHRRMFPRYMLSIFHIPSLAYSQHPRQEGRIPGDHCFDNILCSGGDGFSRGLPCFMWVASLWNIWTAPVLSSYLMYLSGRCNILFCCLVCFISSWNFDDLKEMYTGSGISNFNKHWASESSWRTKTLPR